MLLELLQVLTSGPPMPGVLDAPIKLPDAAGEMLSEADIGGKKGAKEPERFPLAQNNDQINLIDKGGGAFELTITENGQEVSKVTLDLSQSQEGGEATLNIRDGASHDNIEAVKKITAELGQDFNKDKASPSSSPASTAASRVMTNNLAMGRAFSFLMACLCLPIT